MGDDVVFHTYATPLAAEEFCNYAIMLQASVRVEPVACNTTLYFRYLHDSSRPDIFGVPDTQLDSIMLKQDKIVRFGMLEGDAVIDAEWAVYDPQNAGAVQRFAANGSKAKHLALVLNLTEARAMCGEPQATAEACVRMLAASDGAEVVIIKMGPAGAFVWAQGDIHKVPAYKTSSVWKIGSGDMFVAHFARAWMNEGMPAHEAAAFASKATAYYCEKRTIPYPQLLTDFNPAEIKIKPEFLDGKKPQVYLAGPFFDTAQVWFIEEARTNLREMGFKVFSPFHDIGMGAAVDVVKLDIDGIKNSDILFAVVDGLDAGTIYEVGYARALDKPVVILCERESEESMKMAEGTACVISRTYTSALYAALWAAISQ